VILPLESRSGDLRSAEFGFFASSCDLQATLASVGTFPARALGRATLNVRFLRIS